MIDVDSSSFFFIVLVAALAAITIVVVPKGLAPPVVVLELMLGIVIGPEVLDLAHPSSFIEFFSNLGLGMLFYFAGYEIDFERIKGPSSSRSRRSRSMPKRCAPPPPPASSAPPCSPP